jgi:hypothetical protein
MVLYALMVSIAARFNIGSDTTASLELTGPM